MEQMYQTHKSVAEFFIVYLREAHAAGSYWPADYAKRLGITDHSSIDDRCDVAQRLCSEKALTIPCLIDDMDNTAARAYKAWPDRLYLIGLDGCIALAGARGPWGFDPALEKARVWLADHTLAATGQTRRSEP